MNIRYKRNSTLRAAICASLLALSASDIGTLALAESAADNPAHHTDTATPIKHVIIIVGENRSFDHIFATYVPKHRNERILNLLSEGIINADGTPGPNFAKAQQYEITSAPNDGKFFSSADMANKQLYATLPAPDVGGVGPVSPYIGILSLPGGDPGPRDLLASRGAGRRAADRRAARDPPRGHPQPPPFPAAGAAEGPGDRPRDRRRARRHAALAGPLSPRRMGNVFRLCA